MPKKTLNRQELEYILTKNYSPQNLIEFFETHFFDDYNHQFEYSIVISLKTHTLHVLNQFEKYYAHQALPEKFNKNHFRIVLALHDIGKSKAKLMGNKNLQYKYTPQMMKKVLKKLNFSALEIKQMVALVEKDPLGTALITKAPALSIQEIKKLAKKSLLPTKTFYQLLTIYYKCDASSYTKDGWGIPSLDHVFKFTKSKNGTVPKIEYSKKSQTIINLIETALFKNRGEKAN